MLLAGPNHSAWKAALLASAALGICLTAGLRGENAPPASPKSPLSPQEALRQFEVHPSLRIELIAAEPEVVDPVALAFDEEGRLWVVEMIDYPNGPAAGASPRSRIRILEDRDGDGYYETSRVFADNLLFVNGVQPWRGGVIVTLAGQVAWFRDTTGDGQADHRETWFTGFTEENPQLRANHPTFGLDNHIYVANGLRGGTVIAVKDEWKTDAQPVAISSMDFRFHPFNGKYEAVSGPGQFGLAFDDFGNRFVCSNRNPCRHMVLDDRYLKRNPNLAVPSVAHEVSPAGDESRVFAISNAWTTSTLHAGQFTAACGLKLYRGDLLPDEFRGNSFTCEPTGNLVHRDVLTPAGATFDSRPGREGVEFLASRDEWCRPVNVANGPDGALYVIDMYRAVIEHPQYMPVELRNRPDLNDGNDRGRIYRLVPKDAGPELQQRRRPQLGQATTDELVALLEHPNAWHRETAARLIFERQDRTARRPLEKLAQDGPTPEARIHALWALDGLGELTLEQVQSALDDRHPRVREQAVRLSERFLAEHSELLKRLRALAEDDDARLRFQLALSLGEAGDRPEVQETLAVLALPGAADPWTRRAIASSVPEQAAPLIAALLDSQAWETPGLPALVGELAETVGARQQADEIERLLAQAGRIDRLHNDTNGERLLKIEIALLNGLGKGLTRRGRSLEASLDALAETDRDRIHGVLDRVIAAARQKSAAASRRQAAISLLGHIGSEIAGPVLLDLARNEPDQSVRLAAIAALSRHRDPEIGPALLTDFSAQTPAVRRALLDAMLADTDRTRGLLAEIDAKRIAAAELDPTRLTRLSRHREADIREAAARLTTPPADRQQVLEEYQAALTLTADPQRGREVFSKSCTTCHRIGDMGVNVAPDIADSRTRTPEQLLTDILDPNRAIDSNYFSYTVVTVEGQVHTGIIATETAASVTLRQPEGKTVTVLRNEIEELRSNGISLMPVGLEKDISPQQMADLISFIKNWRYLDGRVPIDAGR